MSERTGFYRRTLERLLAEGAIDREMRVLVVAGGDADREALQALGFGDVTISNIDASGAEGAYAPYAWSYQDAEQLDFEDGSFDFAIIAAGLHHCASPHRALLELYRVARRGLLALEAQDSFLMRLAIRAGAVDEYELTAVYANGFTSGGVRNSPVPNYVYRWTEREVEKTIASAAPHARHRILTFREFELPLSLADMRANRLWGIALRVAEPVVGALAKAFPSQANLFAFAVLKPADGELFPWLRLDDGAVAPDVEYLQRRLRG